MRKGFEALIRWQHPDLGLVPPSEFISIAEDAGLTASIGAWVLGEACKQLVVWREQGLTDCFVSVNLSATQFADAGLVSHVDRILKQNCLEPAVLHLEITESVVMEHAERACTTLNQLRALGVHLSIDDFGTGYSSLSYLARFPINKLKIGRSFIAEMMTSDEPLLPQPRCAVRHHGFRPAVGLRGSRFARRRTHQHSSITRSRFGG